jgi:hypothetical protein
MLASVPVVRDESERAVTIEFSGVGTERVRVGSTGGLPQCPIVAVIRFVATVHKESR